MSKKTVSLVVAQQTYQEEKTRADKAEAQVKELKADIVALLKTDAGTWVEGTPNYYHAETVKQEMKAKYY